MARFPRLRPQVVGAVLVAAPLAWLLLVKVGVPANVEPPIGRVRELASWINLLLVPLLGFLALVGYVASGNPYVRALAVAALAFAILFPLTKLFTAYDSYAAVLIYEAPARLIFTGLFLALSFHEGQDPADVRRRAFLVTLALGGLLFVFAYAWRGALDHLAESLEGAHRALEWATAVLAGAASLRLYTAANRGGPPCPAGLSFAFLLTAEQSLLFLYCEPFDLLWWLANALWALSTGLMIWAVFGTVADAEQRRRLLPAELAVGATVAGYEILERLGEGGMGQVFKARHRRLNRVVAVKVIRPEQVENPLVIRRFRREALATARLTHPNIVQVFDASELDGVFLLAMEFVAGRDLGALVQEHGALPVPLACEYVRQASAGLQHAHERGLVHRDIKPSNLLVTSDGAAVKVLDLGVALLPPADGQEPSLSGLTQTGVVMGTPAYMAPEQARDPRHVDIRADVYSLGCTFYHLLTGRVPFAGASLAEVVLSHQLEEPEPAERVRPDIPPGVQAVLRKMMSKQAADRYQTPAEVAEALQPFAATRDELRQAWKLFAAATALPSPATEGLPPAGEPEWTTPASRGPRPGLAVLVGAVVLALVLLTAWGLLRP